MTSKLDSLFADLDTLAFEHTNVTVTCASSSRRYIYFVVTVTSNRDGVEFAAHYSGSNLNHRRIAAVRWEQFYLPKLEGELNQAPNIRSYTANSNIFRALRQVANDAMAVA